MFALAVRLERHYHSPSGLMRVVFVSVSSHTANVTQLFFFLCLVPTGSDWPSVGLGCEFRDSCELNPAPRVFMAKSGSKNQSVF